MRLSSIAHLYTVRLRAKNVLGQELLAVVGLAVGVALLFASQVASASLSGSVTQLTNGVVGSSTYQLQARSQSGINEDLLGRVQRLPGVRAAVPVLEAPAVVSGPSGSRSVDLIATDPRYVHLAGPLLRHFRASQLLHQHVIALPTPIAEAVGTGPLQVVELQVGARTMHVLVGAELNTRNIGALVDSPIAIAPLQYAQSLTEMQGRITRIFVQVLPGYKHYVRASLIKLARNRLNVEPANFDVTLFASAAAPAEKGENLFSWISAVVGFMFAFNAMLLTLPLRRDLIRGLRTNGATRLDIVKALMFDAVVLAALAAVVGLALGDLLSAAVFRSNPGYLSFAFPVGSQRIVTWQSITIAVGAGLLAACVGVLIALRELFPLASVASKYRRGRLPHTLAVGALIGGVCCIGATTVILILAPQLAVLGSMLLVVALLLLLALLLDAVVAMFDRAQSRFGSAATRIAVIELHSPTTRTRSLAIAATGAIAVFGSVAIQGAQHNLRAGLNKLAIETNDVTDLWVSPAGTGNTLGTAPFPSSIAKALAGLPGVQAVTIYRGGFLDVGDRHVWVIAPPRTSAEPVPAGQLTSGNRATTLAHIREGGWAVVSEAIAHEAHLHIGEAYLLPTPNPTSFRIAGFSTNNGWPPGAIIINAEDYAQAWGSSAASALNIALAPGVSPAQGRIEAVRALGPGSGLVVQTASERTGQWETASHQGLSRLTQIATLVMIATVLAMSFAMGAMIWQRRGRFARMKVQGYEQGALWRALLCESALLLGAGCLVGAVFGVYGQVLISHALAVVTGFPVVFAAGVSVAIIGFALVSVGAVALVGVLGYRAVGVRPNI